MPKEQRNLADTADSVDMAQRKFSDVRGGSDKGSRTSSARQQPQTARVKGSQASGASRSGAMSARSSQAGSQAGKVTTPYATHEIYTTTIPEGTQLGGGPRKNLQPAAQFVPPNRYEPDHTIRKMRAGFQRTRHGGRFPIVSDDDSNYQFEHGAINNRMAGMHGPATKHGLGSSHTALVAPPAAPNAPPGVPPRALRNNGFARTVCGGFFPHESEDGKSRPITARA